MNKPLQCVCAQCVWSDMSINNQPREGGGVRNCICRPISHLIIYDTVWHRGISLKVMQVKTKVWYGLYVNLLQTGASNYSLATTVQRHTPSIMKVNARCNLLQGLASTKWVAQIDVGLSLLQTSTTALTFAPAEYCSPVWC